MLETFRDRTLATNMSRWEHPLYKAYLTQSDYEINIHKRNELLLKAEELLMEELPVIPVYFRTVSYMKNPKLESVFVSPLMEIDFKKAFFRH